MTATCVECEADFDVEDPEAGQLVACPECNLDMEVISPLPLELEALVEKEDQDEDERSVEESEWE